MSAWNILITGGQIVMLVVCIVAGICSIIVAPPDKKKNGK